MTNGIPEPAPAPPPKEKYKAAKKQNKPVSKLIKTQQNKANTKK